MVDEEAEDEVVDEVEDEVVDEEVDYPYRLFVVSARALDKKNKPFGFSFCFFASWEIFFRSRQTTVSGPKRSGSIPEKKGRMAWDSNLRYPASVQCSTA